MPFRPPFAVALALTFCLAQAGCGGQTHSSHPLPNSRHARVDVYASLPLQGTWAYQAAGVLNGIRLAYEQARGRAGRWHVRLLVRDDSTAASGGWDATKTAENARVAASDPHAVYYIGELDSAASEVSGPILNTAGVPQVSPLSTYAGLTASTSRMDPSGSPTFLRLDPSDAVQAGALLDAASRARCSRVAVVHDDSLEGTGLASELRARRDQFHITIVNDQSLSAVLPNLGAFVAALKTHDERCLIFAGESSPDAVRLFSNVAAAFPRLLRAFGSDAVCTEPFTNPTAGGLSVVALAAFRCTSPADDLKATSVGRAFLSAYTAAYHAAPDPLAIYGYEAMNLALDTVADVGARGADRTAVRGTLFGTSDIRSATGRIAFDHDGNSTASGYGLYAVGSGGAPAFVEALSP